MIAVDVEQRIVEMLVDVGATAASSVRAARILTAGGSIRDAFAVIEIAETPPCGSQLEAALLVSLAVTTVGQREQVKVVR